MKMPGRGQRASPHERLRTRSVFALSLLVFLIIGIVLVGDFSAQWFLLLAPVAVLLGPLWSVWREANEQSRGDQHTTPRG